MAPNGRQRNALTIVSAEQEVARAAALDAYEAQPSSAPAGLASYARIAAAVSTVYHPAICHPRGSIEEEPEQADQQHYGHQSE